MTVSFFPKNQQILFWGATNKYGNRQIIVQLVLQDITRRLGNLHSHINLPALLIHILLICLQNEEQIGNFQKITSLKIFQLKSTLKKIKKYSKNTEKYNTE